MTHQFPEKSRKVDALLHLFPIDSPRTLQLLFSFSGFSLPAIFLLQLLFKYLRFFSARKSAATNAKRSDQREAQRPARSAAAGAPTRNLPPTKQQREAPCLPTQRPPSPTRSLPPKKQQREAPCLPPQQPPAVIIHCVIIFTARPLSRPCRALTA